MTPQPQPPRPTPAELEILTQPLEARAQHGPRGPGAAGRLRPTGYTTVLKLLQIMTDKGLVTRNESERAHVYQAMAPEEATQKQLVRDLVDRAFGGSVSQLVLHALATRKTSRRDLARIRELLDELEGGER